MVDVMAVSGLLIWTRYRRGDGDRECGDRVVGGDRAIVKQRRSGNVDVTRHSESPLRGLSEISRSLGATTRSWRANAQGTLGRERCAAVTPAMCWGRLGAPNGRGEGGSEGTSVAADETKPKRRHSPDAIPTLSPFRKKRSLALQCRHARSSDSSRVPLADEGNCDRSSARKPATALSGGPTASFSGQMQERPSASSRTPHALASGSSDDGGTAVLRGASWPRRDAVESYSPVRGVAPGISLDSAAIRPARGSP
jgi:hypothetical protein